MKRVIAFGGLILLFPMASSAAFTQIELTPDYVGSANGNYFTTAPTDNPELFLGVGEARLVDFNTAPDGDLTEGGDVNTQYASLGVTMNDIRISSNIFGGNNYGPGFATEDNAAQIFTFDTPILAAGIVNTSPDGDMVRFWSGPDATGEMLLEFNDEGSSGTDRFVGGVSDGSDSIRSFSVSNQGGDLELDEFVFIVPSPPATGLPLIAGVAAGRRRRASIPSRTATRHTGFYGLDRQDRTCSPMTRRTTARRV